MVGCGTLAERLDVTRILSLFKKSSGNSGLAWQVAISLGLLDRLLDQEVVRAQVYGRPFAVVELGLQHQQADQRLALPRVRFEDHVLLLAMAGKPNL
jgi:hypothetical protein